MHITHYSQNGEEKGDCLTQSWILMGFCKQEITQSRFLNMKNLRLHLKESQWLHSSGLWLKSCLSSYIEESWWYHQLQQFSWKWNISDSSQRFQKSPPPVKSSQQHHGWILCKWMELLHSSSTNMLRPWYHLYSNCQADSPITLQVLNHCWETLLQI